MDASMNPGGRRDPRTRQDSVPLSPGNDGHRGIDASSDGSSSPGAGHFDSRSDKHGQPTSQGHDLEQGNSTPMDIDNPETESMDVDVPSAASQQEPRPAASRPPLHSLFDKVCTKNAKCDLCEKRNTSVMQKCRTCGMTTCKACHLKGLYDDRHSLDGLVLDWEPPVRDNRGRSIGTRSIRGVGKARRGRPSRPPGASKAGLGLVREPVPYGKERSLAASSIARLSEISAGSTRDDQSTLGGKGLFPLLSSLLHSLTPSTIDSFEANSPTAAELSNRAPSNQGKSPRPGEAPGLFSKAYPYKQTRRWKKKPTLSM